MSLNIPALIHLNGLELSSSPTSAHKQLLHIRINPHLIQTISSTSSNQKSTLSPFEITPDNLHIKAYVDPSHLSFHSFQNILQLDDCYFQRKIDNKNQLLNLSISPLKKFGNHFQFKLTDKENILMPLDQMDLYTLPFNNISRGGKRMIFSSLKLADTLCLALKKLFERAETKSIWQSDLDLLEENFNSVNHVFRLNNFSPDCKNFKSHYDTPFSDSHRKLYSKFTLLIYLTGGTNPTNGCLRIDDHVIHEIPAFTGIIFDQRYQHEGWPYVENDKVFLRTELIYFVKDVKQDKVVADMFNKACYFQKMAVYEHQNPEYANELQKYSNDLFNHTAKLRYDLAENTSMDSVCQIQEEEDKKEEKEKNTETKYFMKKQGQIFYVTDGNSFWFSDQISVKTGAKLVLVDYFNGKLSLLSSKHYLGYKKLGIGSKPFKNTFISQGDKKKAQKTKTKEGDFSNIDENILSFLDQIAFKKFQNPCLSMDWWEVLKSSHSEQFDVNKNHIHCYQCMFSSTDGESEAREQSLNRMHAKLDGFGVVLFEERVYLNDNKIKIDKENGWVSFNRAFLNRTINFAGCGCKPKPKWTYIGKEYVQVEGFMLPRMKYKSMPELKGYKLSIDIFRNGFIHRSKVSVSRPYAQKELDEKDEDDYDLFFDDDDEYIESDSDYEDVVGKREGEEDEVQWSEEMKRQGIEKKVKK